MLVHEYMSFYYTNRSALQEFPSLRQKWKITILLRGFEVANRLLTRHQLYLAPWMNSNLNKVNFCLLVRSLCNKQNNAWLLGDTEFFFSCAPRYLTKERSSLVRYQVEHEKKNSISPRAMYHSLFLTWDRLAAGGPEHCWLTLDRETCFGIHQRERRCLRNKTKQKTETDVRSWAVLVER